MNKMTKSYSLSILDQQYRCKVIYPPVPAKARGTAEKILVNPYHGCAHDCLFCPANAGYLPQDAYAEFRDFGTIHVVKNICEHLSCFLQQNQDGKIVHLSPVADPFQPVESHFGLTRKIIRQCVEEGIPVAVSTKGRVPNDIQDLLFQHPQSLVQVSIITMNEAKWRYLVRGMSADAAGLLDSIAEMTRRNLFVIGRIDPIFPFITDDLDEFANLVRELKRRNVSHILSSCADIPVKALDREKTFLIDYKPDLYKRYKCLYTDLIHGRYHAALTYRKKLFSNLYDICKTEGMEFSVTWEPYPDGSPLTPEFTTSGFERALFNHGGSARFCDTLRDR